MLQRSGAHHHRSGKARAFVFRDPSLYQLRAGSGFQQMKRMGMPEHTSLGYQKVDSFYANRQYQHAWPLLSHDDLGNSDQSNQTKNILYSMYMPKRNKGTAPWFRGADTYSVKYSEQGRYEYQRYLMINRFPSEYKKHFLRFLRHIRSGGRSVGLPQEALHWLLRMIVDNFNPQHVHYIAAMRTLLDAKEPDMARDVWRIMERQQTWPDSSTLCTYLDVCFAAGEPTWAMEAWNRYGNELKFLQPGEVDPKPITRVPFSLTREELLYLPKWKKHFDHDPNLDVPDLNRFNRTREIYLRMAKVMLLGGEMGLYHHFYDGLVEAMKTTPTPVPEPPNPHMVSRPRWKPYEHLPSPFASPWRVNNNERVRALGPETVLHPESPDLEMDSRFFSNTQFLIHAVRHMLDVVVEGVSTAKAKGSIHCDAATPSKTTERKEDDTPSLFQSPEAALSFGEKLVSQLLDYLESDTVAVTRGPVHFTSFLTSYLQLHRVVGGSKGKQLLDMAEVLNKKCHAISTRKNKKEVVEDQGGKSESAELPAMLAASHYLEILKGLAQESAFTLVLSVKDEAKLKKNSILSPCLSPSGYQYLHKDFDPKATMRTLAGVLQDISGNPHLTWSADMHLEVVKVLVNCGTMKANEYFVQHVLRQFQWSCEFLEVLYLEYRRHEDMELWAELTKRALVWTARYDVTVSETLKRLIEDDYDYIGVHTRTFRELAVFQFQTVEEKRHSRQITSELPNPWIDYVSHALPFPDRDAGYPDEYGDLGQWRAPGGPGSPVKGPGYYAPPMEGEHQRGYTAEWRDLKNPMRPPTFPDPWEKKYKQYARGQHPSYDMTYAGPMPEIFPERRNFRKPTRWDYHDIEKQSKFKISGPY
eukprot:gene7428-5229_t